MSRIKKYTLANLAINLAYGVFNTVLGIVWRSWWFVTLGVYYILLSIMRFGVVHTALGKHNTAADEIFAKKFVGVILVVLSVCLGGTTVLTAIDGHGTKFHPIAMITIALYSFCKITAATVNVVRSRRNSSVSVKTLRNISLADSFASIYSLQRSMLVTFEGMSADNIQLMNILTGTAVWLLVLFMGLNLTEERNTIMAKSKIIEVSKKIEETVVDGYKKVEETVVGGYKKVEDTVVGGYKKVEDKFVDKYLAKDGETAEEAKARIKEEK